jgi:hypothetical protein
MHLDTISNDCALAESATSFVQSVTEDSQKDNRCNDALEGEEILDLGYVSNAQASRLTVALPLYKECTRRGSGAESRVKTQSFLM